jgi:phenylpropionate dioxygenase-like ring-hydroxylating dioxygenase large terminal subunit
MQSEVLSATDHPATFGNWQRLADSWYPIASSRMIKPGVWREFELGPLRLLLIRHPISRKLAAVDALCPHLGVSLVHASIAFESDKALIKCAMHGKKFSVSFSGESSLKQLGLCHSLRSFPVQEHWNQVWIYTGSDKPFALPFTMGQEYYSQKEMRHFFRLPGTWVKCHPHVATINGLDVRHFEHLHQMVFSSEPQYVFAPDDRESAVYLEGRSKSESVNWCLGSRKIDIVSRFVALGGNLSITDVKHPNPFAILLAGKPSRKPKTNEWGCKTTAVLAVPDLNPMRLLQIAALMVYLLKDDMRIMEGYQLEPRFDSHELGLRKCFELVNAMKYLSL